MITRQLRFKCRYCGEFFSLDENAASRGVLEHLIRTTYPAFLQKIEPHECTGKLSGPIGVGDFVGFTEEEAP